MERSMRIIGVPVSVIDMGRLIPLLIEWGTAGKARSVYVRDVHGVMRAADDPKFLELHERADLVVPDGMPLTWIGRSRGYGEIGRTPGYDIVDGVIDASKKRQLRHFFFGGREGVAELMIKKLSARHRDLQVAGFYSPPFREYNVGSSFGAAELDELKMIASLKPDFIWVGLSTPKQEIWIAEAQKHLDHGVLLGVGAAFDFHAELVARAPRWMSNFGFEWLHRLMSDPRRLWKRYLVLAPRFVLAVAAETLRLRRA